MRYIIFHKVYTEKKYIKENDEIFDFKLTKE